jgi:hypothetical protein
MLKGLALSIVFLVGIFWLDQATSYHPTNNDSGSSYAQQQQQAAANQLAKIEISNAKSHKPSPTKKQHESEDFVKWIEWFFSDTNRALVIGTFTLAAGAFLQFGLTWGTSRRQLRAYIQCNSSGVIDGAMAKDLGNNPFLAGVLVGGVTIKNTGRTPAYKVCHWAELVIVPVTQIDSLRAQLNLNEKLSSVIGAACETTKSLRLSRQMTPSELRGIQIGSHAIVVYGGVVYRDIFKRRRTTEYCLSWSGYYPPPLGGTMTFCGRNRAT